MNTVTTILLTIELLMIDPRESKLIDFQDKILVFWIFTCALHVCIC